MENFQSESAFEHDRLEKTISLAKKQLNTARQSNIENKAAILQAKQDLRENSSHSISDLWSSDGFEALVNLSQYVNPVTDKLNEYEWTENRIAMLENLIKSPYFARIDFKYDGEDSFEKIYIGRSSLTNDNPYEMYVFDWRSPVASVFYRFAAGRAFYDAPVGRINGELGLKRQYEIKSGKLEYYFDADVQIIDEFLRKMLSQNTSAKMKTIVETIQMEQDIVIRDMENDLMMVQGVAGSGKTSIALHRAAYLMYQGLSSRLSSNNIMIISPNPLFERYISSVLPELGEDNINSVVFEDFLSEILDNKSIQSRNRFLEQLISNGSYRDIMKTAIEFKTSGVFMEILNRFIEHLPVSQIEFDDISYSGNSIATKVELKEKIISGRKNTPLGVKLKQLEDFILEAAKELHKLHGNRAEYQRVKKVAQNLTKLDLITLYGNLFNNEDYFYSLAGGLSLPHNISDIIRFTRENLFANTLSYDDAAVLAYMKIKINGSGDYKHIKQVVIDEAQDYYPLHFELFNLLFTSAKYTVLGDVNQTLEKREDLTLYEQIAAILNKQKSTLVTMDKSFRCTNEILRFSSRFIPHESGIKSFNREGREPEIYVAQDNASLYSMIADEAASCLEEGYHSVGLICKTERNARDLFAHLRDKIEVQLIKFESSQDLRGIFIIPVYMSKGLEFDAVLVCDADSGNYRSEEDKNLLYVSCTRALHRLNLFCLGEISPLLRSI